MNRLPQELTYVIDLREATHHLAKITLWIPTADEDTLRLIFPVWTPGSYMVREYTRNIESISATLHSKQGQPAMETIELEREGKNRWLARPQSQTQWLCVQYSLYCRENTVRTNWLESDYGFITGAAAFPVIDGRESEAIRVQLQVPKAWRDCATSLQPVPPQQPSEFDCRASCYDELVDSPIVCGNFELRSFEVGEHTHWLANVGGDRLWDLDRALGDMKQIIAEHHRFWGSIPYEQYWFLNLCTEAGGGLEHDNSTVLMCSRWAMRRRESYLNWLALVSHEFFHTWNVRRLRPRILMSYDYEAEQFFNELWIAEGITSYFDDLALVRTGICTREEYLGRLTANIQAVQNAPGRLVQDLADASWDTWTKHYRPDENSVNSRISYYLKGAVLAWLLDARLREESQNQRPLDAVMKELWRRCLDTGYTLEDFNEIVQEFGSKEIRIWLESQVASAQELELDHALQFFGLQIQQITAPETIEKSLAKVWIGSESTPTDGKLFVRRVFRNSPSDRAGLNVDDELISFDGYRVTPETWPSRLEVYEPEEELELLVSRRGKILRLQIVLGHKPQHNWQLEVVPGGNSSGLKAWLLPQT